MILMAIDPGVNNGFAVYDKDHSKWLFTGEVPIWEVFERIDTLTAEEEDRVDCRIYIEDPRQIGGPAYKAQGAGWVKILAGQYHAYCIKRGLKYELIRPNDGYLKKTVSFVQAQTGIKTIEKNHNERDAIMILYFYGLH